MILASAGTIIRDGGLVAFATETVYGLGADATNSEAIGRIFAAKGRPSSNPLIVHVDDAELAKACVFSWPDSATVLARCFWPGPLTLVLRRSGLICDAVTAGLNTVGVRVPSTEVARRLIKAAGRPIAAPSANRSNRISPTRAEHVYRDLGSRVDLLLDSGPTTLGLESTVLDLSSGQPCILRPGPIDPDSITRALGGIEVRCRSEDRADKPLTSPGQLPVHYAPQTPAFHVGDIRTLEGRPWPDGTILLTFGREHSPTPLELPTYHLSDPSVAARELYSTLHGIDERAAVQLLVVLPPDIPEWAAVRDRLLRATRPLS